MKTSLKDRVQRLTDWAHLRIRHQKYRLDGSGCGRELGQMESNDARSEIRTLEAVIAQLKNGS